MIIGYKKIQQWKAEKERKVIARDTLEFIIIVLVFIAAMAIGGRTYPY